MELNESDHKKLVAQLRQSTASLIDQYPFSRTGLRPYRNLLYLIQKEQKLEGEELLNQLKTQLKSADPQQRLATVKLLSSLPLRERLMFLDSNESDIIQLSQAQDYNFEVVAAVVDCLAVSYRLICRFPDVYSVSTNRLISLYCKLLDSSFHRSKELVWNALEMLRSMAATTKQGNYSLIDKVAHTFSTRMEQLLGRAIMFEARVRSRLLYGFAVLLVRCPAKYELLPRLINELQLIMNNLADYEPICESVGALLFILKQTQQSQHIFNRLLKNCHHVIQSVFRLEYLPLLTNILILAENCNNRLKYQISLRALETSRTFQQQYTRLVLIKRSLKNLYQISKQYPQKRESVIRSLFLQGWFVKCIKEDHDIFKEEFLVALISEFFEEGTEEMNDVLDICHRLLDWNCSSQNVEAARFAFQLYLRFLKEAWQRLGRGITPNLNELIDRINQKNIHFLFKMKLLSLLSSLLSYDELKKDLKFDFIQGELRPFMMPKNPKQIFSANYSRSIEGQIESIREVEYIKNILHLLSTLPQNYKELSGPIDILVAEYQAYLGNLESLPDCNRDLINALFELEDQPVISEISRNFLLSSYQEKSQLSIYRQPYEIKYSFFNDSEQSILPCDSPIDVLVTPLYYRNFKVILGLRTISHIQAGAVRLIVSTSLQCLELEFESGAVEIEVEAPGIIHFEVVTETGSSLGKGSYKLLIGSNWRRVDWFDCSGAIKLKVCWEGKGFTARYLGIYWGEPIVIGLEEGSTEISLFVCSKLTLGVILNDLQQLLDELTEGALTLKN